MLRCLERPQSAAVRPQDGPLLLVVIDTEAEFDWTGPFRREDTGTRSLRGLLRVQDIFERFGVRPVYAVDYPVSRCPDSVALLRERLEAGQAEIGAHLHPWTTPPFEEELGARNSYPGNLTAILERRKLTALTDSIERCFGLRPHIYKAGRYGIGPWTAMNLLALGYGIDLSVLPHHDLRPQEGPDMSRAPDGPFWADAGRRLLSIPMSVGYAGALSRFGDPLFRATERPLATKLHLRGLMARLRLLERIVLTPERITLDEQKRLVRAELARGRRLFVYSFHSPSLEPGCTPYVRSRSELASFLASIEGLFEFFMGEVGGRPVSASDIRDRLVEQDSRSGHPLVPRRTVGALA